MTESRAKDTPTSVDTLGAVPAVEGTCFLSAYRPCEMDCMAYDPLAISREEHPCRVLRALESIQVNGSMSSPSAASPPLADAPVRREEDKSSLLTEVRQIKEAAWEVVRWLQERVRRGGGG